MARVTPLNAGYCNHLACLAVRESGFATRRYPIRAFLVETHAGPFLWDTGFSGHYKESCRGMFRIVGWMAPAQYDEDRDSLVRQLARDGLWSRDLRGIVLSHLHADHIAGIRDFPNVPLHAAASAVAAVKGCTNLQALAQGFIPALMPSDFDTRLRAVESFPQVPLPAELAPFEFAWDVSGTSELLVVPLPGHARGHLGAFVPTPAGWTLIASDAAWAVAAYRDDDGLTPMASRVQFQREMYFQTLKNLRTLETRGVRILLSHDNDSPCCLP